ncbi:MAG: hypothetical protein WB660_02510 [Candidatus Sulfotelmatobacter sp.]
MRGRDEQQLGVFISYVSPVDKPEASATYYAEAVTAALRESADPPRLSLPIQLVACSCHSSPNRGLWRAWCSWRRQFRRSARALSNSFSLTLTWFALSGLEDPTKDAHLAVKFLFHDCSPEVAHWALSTLRLSARSRIFFEHERDASKALRLIEDYPDGLSAGGGSSPAPRFSRYQCRLTRLDIPSLQT